VLLTGNYTYSLHEAGTYNGSGNDYALNAQRGLPKEDGYTWHHLDYNPATGV